MAFKMLEKMNFYNNNAILVFCFWGNSKEMRRDFLNTVYNCSIISKLQK